MATIASQVVLHPAVSKSLKYGATTLGRDKASQSNVKWIQLYRAVQYYARFFAWYLLLKGRKEDAARWAALKGHLGTARKLMRLGKPMEHLQAALRATMATAPPAEQITTIARQLSYFGYLSYDAIVWAHSIKFVALSPETAKTVAKRAFQFWFAGIVFSLINGTLKSSRLLKEGKKLKYKLRGEKDVGEETETKAKLQAIKSSQIATRKQFTIDLLDVWIPATGAGILNISEGALGIAGLVSSVLGGKAQWDSVNGSK